MHSESDQHANNDCHPRQAWMGLLARSPLPLLESGLAPYLPAEFQWLRRPETGLMMVQGRAGGTGERFNLGEITVTRCTLRLSQTGTGAKVGVSYVIGRSQRHAQLAAIADALLQELSLIGALEVGLLEPIRRHLDTEQAYRHQRAHSTRVDFLTLAREARGELADEQP